MNNPFYNNGRFISPSLNRARVFNLPGCEEDQGCSGFELFAASALTKMVLEQAESLQLDTAAPDVLRVFDVCFESEVDGVREVATTVARAYGRRLGALLLTLKQGKLRSRTARPQWDDRHWGLWSNIETVWLGGGLVAGRLGPIAASEAQKVMYAAGFESFRVNHSPYAAMMPLIGVARLAPVNAQAMIVTDFGHTSVKRAVAFYEDGRLVELRNLAPVPTDYSTAQAVTLDETAVATFANSLVETLAATWHECAAMGLNLTPTLGVCMACYLVDGHPPVSEMGYYGRLQLLTDNVQTYLADLLSEKLGQSMRPYLLHDAGAAALTVAEAERTVVLTLGTAVGNGFSGLMPQTIIDITREFRILQFPKLL